MKCARALLLRVAMGGSLCIALLSPLDALACTASGVSPSVTICTPASGSGGPAPVHVTALTTDTAHPVTAMKVYLDYTAVYSTSSNSVDTYISPLTTGAHNLTINAWDSSGAVFKAAETFTVTSIGSVALSPASLSFTPQLVGTTSTAQTLTLSNTTASPAAITSIVNSGDFVITGNGCGSSVAANSSCTIAVAFAPTTSGVRAGGITATDSAGTQSSSLSGTGQAQVVSLSPAGLTWGSQVVGTTSGPQPAKLFNGTASAIAINSINASGEFLLGSNNCGSILAPGASCSIPVSFQPTTTGTGSGVLTVSDSAGTQSVALSGSGIANAGPCAPGTANPSVTICSPSAATTNGTPVHLTASTNSGSPVTALTVLVDATAVYNTTSPWIDINVDMSGGAHTITVQATNAAGQTFQSAVAITAQAPAQSWAPCALNTAAQSVTICNPPANGIVSLPLHLAAGATDTSSVSQMQVSIDSSTPTYTLINGRTLDVYINSLTPGPHTLTVSATNSAGVQYNNSVPVTVADNSGLQNLQHIILYVQENRSFDNYFGLLGPYRAAKGFTDPVDGLNLNTAIPNAAGQLVQPYHYRTVCTEDVGEKWDPVRLAIDNGAMDLFLKETAVYEPSTMDPNGNRSIGYYDSTDIPYYYELATQFATSDRYFSSVTAPTAPNRMYLFAATSFGYMYQLDGPAGGWTQRTIFDQLDAAGVSWKYYLQDSTNFLAQWSVYGRDAAKVFPMAQYYTDVANNTLPQVAFIEHAHSLGWDEHPIADVQYGVKATSKIIAALMASPSWATSAFILTYDEAGGLYDHVLPATMIKPDNIKPKLSPGNQPGDFGRTGTRVPIVMVSPWARAHLVSHVWREHTSILRLIEDRFGVPALTARDAAADNMIEMFDFTAPAFATPPPLPAQPTNATCNKSLESQ